MLVTSIFFFSHNVLYLIQNKFAIWTMFNLSSANAFNLDLSKILSFGKELRKVQSECIILQATNQVRLRSKTMFLKQYKNMREKEKKDFFPFSTMF